MFVLVDLSVVVRVKSVMLVVVMYLWFDGYLFCNIDVDVSKGQS